MFVPSFVSLGNCESNLKSVRERSRESRRVSSKHKRRGPIDDLVSAVAEDGLTSTKGGSKGYAGCKMSK